MGTDKDEGEHRFEKMKTPRSLMKRNILLKLELHIIDLFSI